MLFRSGLFFAVFFSAVSLQFGEEQVLVILNTCVALCLVSIIYAQVLSQMESYNLRTLAALRENELFAMFLVEYLDSQFETLQDNFSQLVVNVSLIDEKLPEVLLDKLISLDTLVTTNCVLLFLDEAVAIYADVNSTQKEYFTSPLSQDL